MRDFNDRFAFLSTSLISLLEQLSYGMDVSEAEVAASWLGRNVLRDTFCWVIRPLSSE